MTNLATGKSERNRPTSGADLIKRLATGLRTALILLTVAVSVYVAYGFGRLLAEWRQGSHVVRPASATTPGFESMAAMLPLDGPWMFANLEWSVKSHSLAASEIGTRFDSLADDATVDAVDDYPEASGDLFEFARMLRVEPIDRGNNQVYRLDRHDLKAMMVVRRLQNSTKALGLAVALPLAEGRWQFIEILPRAASDRLQASVPHLLPIPQGSSRSGGRFAEDGTLLLELVSLESNSDDLLALWREAGWHVRPSGMGAPGEFSYLCGRGDEVVYAWSANPGDSLTSLMLVRSPSGADTGAQRSLANRMGE